uniref:Uncharacterized protein n=1 Tax=Ursus maritimus TaxID=29073 RepID=A0A452UPP9_URSMA
MSVKVELETNFAECVLNAGKIILGNKQRNEMNPQLQKKQNKIIVNAICALLNSGGGVVKAEIENKDYNFEIHGVGLKMPSIFKGYLDEMQQGDLFLIFVKSWNAEASGVRLATLSSNLYHRYRTSNDVMNSQEALAFLKGRSQTLVNTNDSNSLSPQKVQVGVQNDGNIRASAAALFARTRLQFLEKLNFTKSLHVEFKMFSTEVSQCFNESLPSCVSAFANTEGGYIFFGVHDETRQVIGCEKEKIDLATLSHSIDYCIRNLPVHHFCTQRCEIKYAVKFLEVHNQGVLHGYVCAVKVERFCCAVFAKVPSSWQVKDNRVKQLATKEWIAWMMEADPGQGAESATIASLLGAGGRGGEREVLSELQMPDLLFSIDTVGRSLPFISSAHLEYLAFDKKMLLWASRPTRGWFRGLSDLVIFIFIPFLVFIFRSLLFLSDMNSFNYLGNSFSCVRMCPL